jgi:hypothetical protein
MQIGNPRFSAQRIQDPDKAKLANQPIQTRDTIVANKNGSLNAADLQGAVEQATGRESIFIQSQANGENFVKIDLTNPENAAAMNNLLAELKSGAVVNLDQALMAHFSDGTSTLKDAKSDRRDLKDMGIKIRDGLDQTETAKIFDKLMAEGATEGEIQAFVDQVNQKIDRHEQKLSFQIDPESGCLNYKLEDNSQNVERERGRLKVEGRLAIDIRGGKIHKVRDGEFKLPTIGFEPGKFDVDVKVEKGPGHTFTLRKSSEERSREIDFGAHFKVGDCSATINDQKAFQQDLKKLGINLKNGLSREEYTQLESYVKADVSDPAAVEKIMAEIRIEGKVKPIDCGGFEFRDDTDTTPGKPGKTITLPSLPKIKIETDIEAPRLTFTPGKLQLPQYERERGGIDIDIPKLKWEPGSKTVTGVDPLEGSACPDTEGFKIAPNQLAPTSAEPDYSTPIEPFEKDLQGRYKHDTKTNMTGKDTDTPAEQVVSYFEGLPGCVDLTVNANSNLLRGSAYNDSLTETRYEPFNGLTEASDSDNIQRGTASSDAAHRQYIQDHFGLVANDVASQDKHRVEKTANSTASDEFVKAANALFTLPAEKDGSTLLQLNRDVVKPDGSRDPIADNVLAQLEKKGIKLTAEEKTKLCEYAQSYMDHRSFNLDIKATITNEQQYEELKNWAASRDLSQAGPEVQQAHAAIQSALNAWEQKSATMTDSVFSNFTANVSNYQGWSSQFAADSVPAETRASFSAAFDKDIASIAACPAEKIKLDPANAQALGLSADQRHDKAAVLAAMEQLKTQALGGQ